jgi:hypothetical protein
MIRGHERVVGLSVAASDPADVDPASRDDGAEDVVVPGDRDPGRIRAFLIAMLVLIGSMSAPDCSRQLT